MPDPAAARKPLKSAQTVDDRTFGIELSLRDRKKLQLRRLLIDTAVDRFSANGFDNISLEALCAEVGVSKRTFFRYFASKEDVAMAPLQDMWQRFIPALQGRDLAVRPVMEVAFDAVVETLRNVGDVRWCRLTRLGLRLAEQNSAISAHNLQFCERTTQQVLEVLRPALAIHDPTDPRLRLAIDIFLGAFRLALGTWASTPDAAHNDSSDQLVALLRTTVDALPASLELTAASRVE
jgi:AcrR family transcriptional regulator